MTNQEIQNVVTEISKLMNESQEAYSEVERVQKEYSDATNHYNKIINDISEERDNLRDEVDLLALKIDKLNAEILTLKNRLPRHDETIVSKAKFQHIIKSRKEPSRLEIAAIIFAAWQSNPFVAKHQIEIKEDYWTEQYAVENADALIAAAKEAK